MNGCHVIPRILFSVVGTVQRNDPDRLRQVLQERNLYGHDDMAFALAVAADRGLYECASILLEANAMPNIHDASGFTPLITACKNGHRDIVELLLNDNSCKVNKATFHIRATALHWASTNGHAECVDLLLKAGANPQARTIHCRTPLMLAARCRHHDIAWQLIQMGADVNARDFEKATALHLAAEEGGDDCVRTLLKAGADINAQMKNGDTPVMGAARKCQTTVLRTLLRRATLDLQKRGHYLTALHWAASGGNRECVELLVCAGLDVNSTTLDSYYGGDYMVNAGVTPLMLAAERGHVGAVRYLIEVGATIDAWDMEGRTALLYTIRGNHCACAETLLRAGADPDGVVMKGPGDLDPDHDERGLSPLFQAIRQEKGDVIKVLLRAQCNLDVLGFSKDGEYVTPFEFAMSRGLFRIARMLIMAGSERMVTNSDLIEEAMAILLRQNEEEFEKLSADICCPPCLLQTTRNRIRHYLGRRAMKCVVSLPLPSVLRNYVALGDLDDL